MEVRGGCGYIEEWSDPRLLRDAHLGSIWEGTSNIVALDVLRAIRREGSLPVLRAHVDALLADAEPAADAACTADVVERAFGLADDAAQHDEHTMQRLVNAAQHDAARRQQVLPVAQREDRPLL